MHFSLVSFRIVNIRDTIPISMQTYSAGLNALSQTVGKPSNAN
jgi:hypothetical protein